MTTTSLLIIFCSILYGLGGFFATLVMGWNTANVIDLLKIIFWPIAVFFEN